MWSFGWLFVLEAVTITTTNAATILIFTRTRRLHSKQYIMIISQAVADLFIGLVSVPMFTAWSAKRQGETDSNLTGLVFYLQDTFFGGASLFGLAALAIERAHATYFPFRHSTLGKRPYIIGIVLMWTAPFMAVVPRLFVEGKMVAEFIIIASICFPLVLIFASYSLIILKVRCTRNHSHDVTIQENKKLTVTLAIVTFLSLVMWLPFQCLVVARIIGFPSFIYYFAKFFQYGNSLVNSVVYAFRMREIKREILRVFRCCRRNQVSINNETELVNT